MGQPTWVGVALFFGLPLLLWIIGTAAVKYWGFGARVVAFFAGSDNRLSLSKMQAFFWTLTVFGSFAAAMAIHEKIYPVTTRESKERVERAKAEAERAAKAVADGDAKLVEARKKVSEFTAGKAAADIRATAARSLAAAAPANVEAAKAAEEAGKNAEKAALELLVAEGTAARAAEDADAARKAKTAAERAVAVSGNEWVKIPAELLALTGIAIGSGIFSSLIAATKSEEKTASVTGVQVVGAAEYDANTAGPWTSPPTEPYCLVINGRGMTRQGHVKISGRIAPVRKWEDDGTRIVVDLPTPLPTKPKLIVDTGNGKLCYKLTGTPPGLALGGETTYYEFGDLFRDDKNPRELALMKFQMFGWTVVAISIYAWLFLSDLHDHIETLPRVDSSIVLLTGLSQAGYLTGKAVSNVNNPPS